MLFSPCPQTLRVRLLHILRLHSILTSRSIPFTETSKNRTTMYSGSNNLTSYSTHSTTSVSLFNLPEIRPAPGINNLIFQMLAGTSTKCVWQRKYPWWSPVLLDIWVKSSPCSRCAARPPLFRRIYIHIL